MKLNQLRNIIAIAERGSLRAAARDLGLAQPALSRSIRELEHELGVQLFERRARGMIMTQMGLAFVRRASNVMTEVRRAREELEQLEGGTGGNVVAAMSIVPHLATVPRVLRPFWKRYQNVELHLIEGQYPAVESRLKDGSIDFYVGPPPEQKLAPELVSELMFENELRDLLSKRAPAGRRQILEAACRVGLDDDLRNLQRGKRTQGVIQPGEFAHAAAGAAEPVGTHPDGFACQQRCSRDAAETVGGISVHGGCVRDHQHRRTAGRSAHCDD